MYYLIYFSQLKTATFELRTRSVSSSRFICSASEIEALASGLLEKEYRDHQTHGGLRVRLMGVRMSNFPTALEQGQRTLEGFFRPSSTSTSVVATSADASTSSASSTSTSSASSMSSMSSSMSSMSSSSSLSSHCAAESYSGIAADDIDESVLDELPPELAAEIRKSIAFNSKPTSNEPPPRSPQRELPCNEKKRPVGISASEVSEEVLRELPLELQAEVRRQMDLESRTKRRDHHSFSQSSVASVPDKKGCIQSFFGQNISSPLKPKINP